MDLLNWDWSSKDFIIKLDWPHIDQPFIDPQSPSDTSNSGI